MNADENSNPPPLQASPEPPGPAVIPPVPPEVDPVHEIAPAEPLPPNPANALAKSIIVICLGIFFVAEIQLSRLRATNAETAAGAVPSSSANVSQSSAITGSATASSSATAVTSELLRETLVSTSTIALAPELSVSGSASVSAGASNAAPEAPKHPTLGLALISLVGLAFLGGLIVSAAALYAYWREPRARDKLRQIFMVFSIRPLPAVRAVDFIAVIMVFMSSAAALNAVFASVVPATDREVQLAGHFIISDLAFLSGVLCAILLARVRARNSAGSFGFWPFWDRAYVFPKRTIGKDITLGLICYPLILWIIAATGVCNNEIVKALGDKPEPHALVPELAKQHELWTLLVIFFAGTLGAAFLEETLFRGVLYNVCRRYMRGRTAAILAAFIFAILHLNPSQILPLFALGLILTWLYDKTGRLIAGITLHFVNNLVSLLVALLYMSQKSPLPTGAFERFMLWLLP